MAILLQYNSAETHSLGELSTVTLLPRDLLSRVLAPLVKLKILIAEGHEHYRLNFDFRSDNTRVYTDVALEAVEDDIKTTEDDVKALEDRKRLIQFTVSKCVKDYKRIKTQSLIQETLTRLNNRLSPTIKEIKVAIEVCIEKEYIGRVEGQRDVSTHSMIPYIGLVLMQFFADSIPHSMKYYPNLFFPFSIAIFFLALLEMVRLCITITGWGF
ncbi:hypothetical protein FRC15_002692 [Serendipita sp. 397]|nr:hypothetical protein FRC15_002692 [Serendipita sp. 397]